MTSLIPWSFLEVRTNFFYSCRSWTRIWLPVYPVLQQLLLPRWSVFPACHGHVAQVGQWHFQRPAHFAWAPGGKKSSGKRSLLFPARQTRGCVSGVQRSDCLAVDWLIDWLIRPLIDWSIDRLIVWLNEWMNEWMKHWSTKVNKGIILKTNYSLNFER